MAFLLLLPQSRSKMTFCLIFSMVQPRFPRENLIGIMHLFHIRPCRVPGYLRLASYRVKYSPWSRHLWSGDRLFSPYCAAPSIRWRAGSPSNPEGDWAQRDQPGLSGRQATHLAIPHPLWGAAVLSYLKYCFLEFPSWCRGNNPTKNHEVAGLIPAPAQWVKDLALL